MMCYKDRTFCRYWLPCKDGYVCDRALTPKVMEEAEKWMVNPPICTYTEKPDCFKGDK